MKREVVEVCPHCMNENIYKNWDTDIQGYTAKCQHCGKNIRLCSECRDAKDNPKHICDWHDGFCFRDEKKHRIISKADLSKAFEALKVLEGLKRTLLEAKKIRDEIINCENCIFYEPKPGDPAMGTCNYKNRDEVVFDDDYCSRGERK